MGLGTLGRRMGPMRVMEGQAAEVRRRERWEAARNRRKSNSRNVCLLAEKQAISRFFSIFGNHERRNLLTHRDQARCSGGPSPPLFAHRFYISCSSSKLCFLAKL